MRGGDYPQTGPAMDEHSHAMGDHDRHSRTMNAHRQTARSTTGITSGSTQSQPHSTVHRNHHHSHVRSEADGDIHQAHNSINNRHEYGADGDGSHYFMSEPSLSEDASSSYARTPIISPLDNNIIMDSPSNNSISSIGSPSVTHSSATAASMRLNQISEISGMGSLLGPMEGRNSPTDDVIDGIGPVSFPKSRQHNDVEGESQTNHEGQHPQTGGGIDNGGNQSSCINLRPRKSEGIEYGAIFSNANSDKNDNIEPDQISNVAEITSSYSGKNTHGYLATEAPIRTQTNVEIGMDVKRRSSGDMEQYLGYDLSESSNSFTEDGENNGKDNDVSDHHPKPQDDIRGNDERPTSRSYISQESNTPESQRYHTAQENVDGSEEGESSSDLSYDSSSKDDNYEDSPNSSIEASPFAKEVSNDSNESVDRTDKGPHFLNKPLSSLNQAGDDISQSCLSPNHEADRVDDIKIQEKRASLGEEEGGIDASLRKLSSSWIDTSPDEEGIECEGNHMPGWESPHSEISSVEQILSLPPNSPDPDCKDPPKHECNMSAAATTPPPYPPGVPSFQYSNDEDSITPKRRTHRTQVQKSSIMVSDNTSIERDLSVPSVEDIGKDNSIAMPSPADFEATPKTRRKRLGSSDKRGPGSHRRTRSGDDAAATLLTGSSDWIGMEMDKLPLPSQREADDEQDDDDGNQMGDRMRSNRKIRRMKRSSSARNAREGTSSWMMIQKSITADDVDMISKNPAAIEEGISTRFSPRIAGTVGKANIGKNDEHALLLSPVVRNDGQQQRARSLSLDEASVSTTESNFSWITRGMSFVSKDVERKTYSDQSGGVISGLENDMSSGEKDGLLQYSPHLSSPGYGSAGITSRDAPHNQKLQQGSLPPHKGLPPMQLPSNRRDQEVKEMLEDPPLADLSERLISINNTPPIESVKNKDYPTFRCPKCNTVQREFFTVASARKQFESPAGYLVSYFIIYMILSLFIFGMEEGWPPLDCVYFSVTTLTLTGLGDYVPTSNAAKIICSVFIYFGIACIGLLLGSLHASSLDDAAKKVAKENMGNNCPGCAMQSTEQTLRARNGKGFLSKGGPRARGSKIASRAATSGDAAMQRDANRANPLQTIDEAQYQTNKEAFRHVKSPFSPSSVPDSPAPLDVMDHKSHTRHFSLDSPDTKNIFDPGYSNRKRHESEITQKAGNIFSSLPRENAEEMDLFADNPRDIEKDDSHSQASSFSSSSSNPTDDSDIFRPVSKIKAAKYVFLTLKQAVANSLFVIAIGSIGFYYIERMSAVDAFYFTTVLLTTVGYGDIVPKTTQGKLFTTIYGLIAGTVLLHNVSMISMIPLELRKRRIERAVLMQFGDELDDAVLRELATGPLVRRLQISDNSQEGLSHCTREMFALAMLVRLGRITEQDVRSTFAAFKRLDRDNDGLLTTEEIIMSAVERKKRMHHATLPKKNADSAMQNMPPEQGLMMMSHSFPGRQPQSNMSPQSNPLNGRDDFESRLVRGRGLSFESTYSALTYEEDDYQGHNWLR